jgi:acyl phosphate:glycerol-3-phosphate acyltransferase
MLELGVKVLLAYLLGSVIGSLVLGRLWGGDIRSEGSGNAGATNALRTRGKFFALGVIVIDIAKGAIAVTGIAHSNLFGLGIDSGISRPWLAVACATAAIVGHVYPLWFDFRGGKGAATIVGAIAAVATWLLIPMATAWVLVLLLSGFVGLATICAAVIGAGAVLVHQPANVPLLAFTTFMAVFVLFTHRSNIQRMLSGRENRSRRLWLFGRRA